VVLRNRFGGSTLDTNPTCRRGAYGTLGTRRRGRDAAFCASLTNSATETWLVFCITRTRWVLIVRSVTPQFRADLLSTLQLVQCEEACKT
jgi:hypothetical protein